jgi:hypothetical protein
MIGYFLGVFAKCCIFRLKSPQKTFNRYGLTTITTGIAWSPNFSLEHAQTKVWTPKILKSED